MLRVKQTLEHLQLDSFNGQANTPSLCLVEKRDLKRFKLVPRTLQILIVCNSLVIPVGGWVNLLEGGGGD